MQQFTRRLILGWYLLWLFGGHWLISDQVYAGDTCSGSVSPGTVSANSESRFSVNVTNTGDFTGQYVMVKAPSGDFALVNYGIDGWTVSANTSEMEIWGGTVGVGETFSFEIGANIGPNEAAAANWWVGLSFGGPYIQCTGGPYGTAISGSTDTVSPVQSEPSITGLSNSSATIVWTTNEPSTSDLYFGPTFETTNTQAYNGDLVTEHSMSLSGLEANKTYYFKYRSVDASGNASNFKDFYSFTTVGYAQAEVVTETVTKTITLQATPPPVEVKTIIIQDVTAPSVVISTELGGVYERAPTIRGVAQDGKGVFRVDYSTDGGRNWLPVDEMSDLEAQKMTFGFTPLGLLDGNYAIKVRAIDTSNNAGFSGEETLIIDRLPPRVGATLLSIGAQPMQPTTTGVIYGLRGVSQKIVLSAVGGATEINVVSKTEMEKQGMAEGWPKILGANEQIYSLVKNSETGLWSGALNFAAPGIYQLAAKAVDGAGNVTERKLQAVHVLPNGHVGDDNGILANVTVTVMVLDPNVNRYVEWDGKSFLQENPQKTNSLGEYKLLLPPGTYYLEAKQKGYKLLRTPIFTLQQHTPIISDFKMEKLSSWSFWGREWFLPTFKRTIATVELSLPTDETRLENALVGKEMPFFTLNRRAEFLYATDLIGKPTIVSFLTSWSPTTADQLHELDTLLTNGIHTVGVFVQETDSALALYAKRGDYQTALWSDEDSELTEQFGVVDVPTHIVLDSKGQVQAAVRGFRSASELRRLLGQGE